MGVFCSELIKTGFVRPGHIRTLIKRPKIFCPIAIGQKFFDEIYPRIKIKFCPTLIKFVQPAALQDKIF